MKAKLFFSILILLGGIFIVAGRTLAGDYEVGGNAAGSKNSINVSGSSSQTTQQSNSAEVNNNSNSSANTGGNETDGGSVKTGDVNIVEQIINKLNLNQAQTDCCPTPAPTTQPSQGKAPTNTPTLKATPTKAPAATTDPGQPTNTPVPEAQGGQGGVGGPSNDSGGSGGVGGGAKAEVLGLAAASGEVPWAQALQVLGLLCTTVGAKKLAKEIKRG